MGTPTAYAAVAIRVVARRLGHRLGSLMGVDMGHDDALHATVQETQDSRVLMVGNPRDGGDAKHFGSTHHVFHLVQVHGTVLAVDHHEVETDGAKQLHQVRSVTADDGAEHNFALGQLGLCGIGTHSAPVLVRWLRRSRVLHYSDFSADAKPIM